jgi:Sigma-70, region 4
MAPLDNLPPDQRAVLQMVLQRGRSYDEIANMLSIDRSAVRQRALDGFDAIAPAAVIPGPERALVTDYLLRQLPDKVADQVYTYLEASDADREWALAVAAKIEPLTSGGLPEIPVGAPLGADDGPDGGLEQDSDPPAVDPEVASGSPERRPVRAEAVVINALASTPSPAPSSQSPPSSRRGGAILLISIPVVIVLALIVGKVITSGGSSKPKPVAVSTQTTHSAATVSTTTTATTGASTPLLAQLNLNSPTGAQNTVGIAQVVRTKKGVGVVIDAEGLPPNTTHNAYGVWLYSSPTSHYFVGFVPTLVGKSGRMATGGQLPAGATRFNRILVTLETQSKPTTPGEVVLSGPFREHS